MPRASANGIELEYETLVLVMGMGMQLTAWPVGFCEVLGAHGFRVVRFDNRDMGLSTLVDGGPEPDLGALLSGDHSTAPYRMSDLVIHGDADQLITPGGGEATAAALPGSELLVIPGMGHDLPEALWPMIADAIAANARRAGQPSAASRIRGRCARSSCTET